MDNVVPEDLLTPKPISSVRPITTAERIAQSPFSMRVNTLTDTPAALTQQAVFNNNAACPGGGIPPTPALLHISDEFQPAVGVYILPGSTASGKSILSSAMIAWANAQGIPASYLYVFEPRAQPFKYNNATKFGQPGDFVQDMTALMMSRGRPSEPELVVIDSATLPMKAYSSAPGFEGQSTFSGGSQPSDRGFLDAMSKLAESANTCIILVLNSVLVPYAADLQGAVEGMITVTDVMHFSIQDRTTYSARTPRSLEVPLPFVNAALTQWNFGTYAAGSVGVSWTGNRAGIYKYKKPQ